jgi:hypothetical protein
MIFPLDPLSTLFIRSYNQAQVCSALIRFAKRAELSGLLAFNFSLVPFALLAQAIGFLPL